MCAIGWCLVLWTQKYHFQESTPSAWCAGCRVVGTVDHLACFPSNPQNTQSQHAKWTKKWGTGIAPLGASWARVQTIHTQVVRKFLGFCRTATGSVGLHPNDEILFLALSAFLSHTTPNTTNFCFCFFVVVLCVCVCVFFVFECVLFCLFWSFFVCVLCLAWLGCLPCDQTGRPRQHVRFIMSHSLTHSHNTQHTPKRASSQPKTTKKTTRTPFVFLLLCTDKPRLLAVWVGV